MPAQEGDIDVEARRVHYQIYGHGPHAILMLPGTLGTAETDYHAQVEGESSLDLDKYTLVVMEPAGWGRSRPPEREYNDGMFDFDIRCAIALMDHLGHELFSVIGWTEGAKLALYMALQHPGRVRSVITIAASFIITPLNMNPLLTMSNVKLWEKARLDRYVALYGLREFEKLYAEYIEYIKTIKKKAEVYAQKKLRDRADYRMSVPASLMPNIKNIQCPALLLHGDNDQLVSVDHTKYCYYLMANSEMINFPGAGNNLHQSDATKFKEVSEAFLDNLNANNA